MKNKRAYRKDNALPREAAETEIASGSMEPGDMTPEAVRTLIHELQVRQTELETENKELRSAQAKGLQAHSEELQAQTEELTAINVELREREDLLLVRSQELEKARREAENDRRRLEAVMEALPVGMAIVDAQGGLIQFNDAYDQVWRGPRPLPESVSEFIAIILQKCLAEAVNRLRGARRS